MVTRGRGYLFNFTVWPAGDLDQKYPCLEIIPDLGRGEGIEIVDPYDALIDLLDKMRAAVVAAQKEDQYD